MIRSRRRVGRWGVFSPVIEALMLPMHSAYIASFDHSRCPVGLLTDIASPSPPARNGTARAAPGSGVWIPLHLAISSACQSVSHYARCIPSKALYRRCLQRCSDKGSYRTELERPRVAEAKCNTGCSTIEHRHSRLPSCEGGI